MSNKEDIINQKNWTNLFLFFLMIFIFISFLSLVINKKPQQNKVSEKSEIINPFDDLKLKAKSAYVWDIKNQKALFSKNESQRMSLASITKMMTALTAVEEAPLYTIINIDREAIKTEGDSGLRTNEKWKLKDLLDFSLMTSSNDGMSAIAMALGDINKKTDPKESEKKFVIKMNEKARKIGLLNSYYFNETGLDESNNKGGAYGTAKDEARLFEYVLLNHPEVLSATQYGEKKITSLSNITHDAKNTNIIINELPGALASKTGFTNISGGNLVVIFNPDLERPIIVVVLGSTEEDRFSDVSSLINASLDYIKNVY